jgi:hypothetical protein
MNIDALLEAMPYRPPLTPTRLREIKFVTWNGKPSPTYNGFTSDERLRGWQMVKWLSAQNILMSPDRCDICGSQDRLQRHSENYYNPFRAAVVCGNCHRLIHFRFWRWNQWRKWCHANDPAGIKWFSMLETKQPNIATHLFTKHGQQVLNLKSSPLYKLPPGCDQLLADMEFPP